MVNNVAGSADTIFPNILSANNIFGKTAGKKPVPHRQSRRGTRLMTTPETWSGLARHCSVGVGRPNRLDRGFAITGLHTVQPFRDRVQIRRDPFGGDVLGFLVVVAVLENPR